MATFDPVLLEVLKNEFIFLVEESGSIIKRTARSFAAREGGDFSTYLMDSQGALIARGGQATWYVPNTMPAVLERYGDRFKPGDIVISNDPYTGGTHLPDLLLIMPVFWQEALIGFVGNAMHHGDIGGRAVGGMSPTSRELYEEGLVLPRVLLYQEGRPNQAIFDILRANVRGPEELLGDLDGQVAGCWSAERGLVRLVEKYGLDEVQSYGQHLIDYTEKVVRNAIRSIPDGIYTTKEVIEADGARVTIALSVTVDDSDMILDFTGSDLQVPIAINVPPATVAANTVANFHLLFGLHDLPSNAGMIAPFRFIAPEGTVLHPRFPAAVGSRSTVTMRLESIFLDAMAQAIPDRVPAPAPCVGIMVYTPDTGGGQKPQVLFDLWPCSRGARPMLDGLDTPVVMNRIPGEVMEQDSSVCLLGYGFVPDTGGAGRFRSGLATYRRWRFLKPGRLYNRNLRLTPIPGRSGGREGQRPRMIITARGREIDCSDKAIIEIAVEAGDELLHIMPAGGGNGDPSLRDPQKIHDDLFNEKLSMDYVRREYPHYGG